MNLQHVSHLTHALLTGKATPGELQDHLRRIILEKKKDVPPRVVRILAVMHDFLREWEGSLLDRLNMSMLCQMATSCTGISVFGMREYTVSGEGRARILTDSARLGLQEDHLSKVESLLDWAIGEDSSFASIYVWEDVVVWVDGGVLVGYESERENSRFFLFFLIPREKAASIPQGSVKDMPEGFWNWRILLETRMRLVNRIKEATFK